MTAIERLVNSVLPTGGWGYAPGQGLHLEPTCYALLALLPQRCQYEAIINQAFAALETQREASGLYRLERGRPQAIWPTAMVLFTKQQYGMVPGSEQTARRLLSIRGRTINGDPEVKEMMDINPERVGWPWADGTFAWVEPTAWAVLSLRASGLVNEPRVIEGSRLLLDRAFQTGGVNYGNRKILEAMTEPIPGPTAVMLTALQNTKHELIEKSAQYLAHELQTMDDLEHLSWGVLALNLHGVDVTGLTEKLSRVYGEMDASGRPISTVRVALVAAAAQVSNINAFRLAATMSAPISQTGATVPPAKPEDPPRPGFVERVKSRFRNLMVRGISALREPPACNGVHIAKSTSYDDGLFDVIKQQYEHFRQHVPIKGKRVVLKPNLVEYRQAQVINTDPRVIDAVIQLCQEEGAAEVVVAEGPGHWRNVEFLVEASGLGAVLRARGVRFVDLNHDEPVKVPNLGRTTGLDFLYLTRTVLNAEVFISMPKLKTHHWAVATLSLKNLFGTVPGICYGWPKNELHWRGIPNSIIDIACTQTPHLAIVDGIMAMEGDGPLAGPAREMGVMVMGVDLVGVDATCCRLMKLPAERIMTLALGAHVKLGRLKEEEIKQIGCTIEECAQAFAWPPKIEKQLMPLPGTSV